MSFIYLNSIKPNEQTEDYQNPNDKNFPFENEDKK